MGRIREKWSDPPRLRLLVDGRAGPAGNRFRRYSVHVMFTRTVTQDIPDREKVETEQLCPPHAFDQGWGLAPDEDLHADTVPVLFCGSCGEIRLMRVPADAG